jgi:hypothetical protein
MFLTTQYKTVTVPKPPRLAQEWGHNMTIYDSDPAGNLWRTSLGIHGKNPLVVVGLNPSVATDEKSDRTITRIKEYASWHGFDSFVMHNLSAQRTKEPLLLSIKQDIELHRQNLKSIQDSLERDPNPHLLAVWGENIYLRSYLKLALQEIMAIATSKSATWLHIGPKFTRQGHPLHPVRGSYQPLYHFNVEDYFYTRVLSPGC